MARLCLATRRRSRFVWCSKQAPDFNVDSDHDGISDAWEYAHSPNQSLDDFGGGPAAKGTEANSQLSVNNSGGWINPYAPGEPGWIPVSANDWDGDGFSNLTEFKHWQKGEQDGEGFPFDPTFINSTGKSSLYLQLPAIIGAAKKAKK